MVKKKLKKLYCERYLSIQSMLGEKDKNTNISTFLAYTYIPKLTFVSFFFFFLFFMNFSLIIFMILNGQK